MKDEERLAKENEERLKQQAEKQQYVEERCIRIPPKEKMQEHIRHIQKLT